MRDKGNMINLHDVELFDITTTNCNYFGRGTTTTWKRDEIIDKVFVRLAKKLEKKVRKMQNNA